MRIAIDGMGGDHAPRVIVQGTQQAAKLYPDTHFEIFGIKDHIERYLHGEENIHIVPTTEVITGEDDPVRAVRRKKDSSLVRAAQSVKKGDNDALFSAGNTGALLAAGTLIVGRIPHIDRPALMGMMPDLNGSGRRTIFLDLGANAESKATTLNQYGTIGSYFAKTLTGSSRPEVALLNNGTEATKGNPLTQEAHQLLQENEAIYFVGNIEAREILNQQVDVIVADGFTGNATLKTIEGTALTMTKLVKNAITQSGVKGKMGALLLKDGLSQIKSQLDYTELGGAILVGVKAPIMKTHGSTDQKAVVQTLGQIRRVLKANVVGQLIEFFADNDRKNN